MASALPTQAVGQCEARAEDDGDAEQEAGLAPEHGRTEDDREADARDGVGDADEPLPAGEEQDASEGEPQCEDADRQRDGPDSDGTEGDGSDQRLGEQQDAGQSDERPDGVPWEVVAHSSRYCPRLSLTSPCRTSLVSARST